MDEYRQRIALATTGLAMNELAAEASVDDELSAEDKQQLQAEFGVRMRQLWPRSFRR